MVASFASEHRPGGRCVSVASQADDGSAVVRIIEDGERGSEVEPHPRDYGWLPGEVPCVDIREAAVEQEWSQKGATLSDKTARKQFGLTQAEIEAAIEAGQLQYRVGVVHGNPWLRLLRREVEELMESTYNDRDHRQRRAKAELGRVDLELKHLQAEVAALEEQRAKLLADLQE